MASKLLFLLMGCKTFDKLPLLEQLRGVIRALQTSMFIFLTKIVSNVSLKTLTILVKKLILNNWLGRGHGSADLYIAILKIPKKMCINERQVKME